MSEKILFTGKTHTTGGRDGAARSGDGFVDLKLPQPHPAAENLFGVAWSACFIDAIEQHRRPFPAEIVFRQIHGGEARFTWAGRSKFVRVTSMKSTTTSARSQTFLIALETREQQRFFEQALAGRTDLLGRRSSVAGPAHGEVLPARWITQSHEYCRGAWS